MTQASRVLITGANGQLGRALARAVWPAGTQVVALPRAGLDVAEAHQVEAVVGDLRPDLIINAAAYTDVGRAEVDAAAAFRVNAMGPHYLAEAAARYGGGLIHVSTDFVFSGPGPHAEGDVPNPINCYGASKLAGELAVQALCPAAVVVRTAWVFDEVGPNFVTRLLERASAPELKMVSDEIGCPTSAHDLAEGLVVLAAHLLTHGSAPDRQFHLVNEGAASRLEMAEAILDHRARRGGSVPVLVPVPAAELTSSVRRPVDSRLAVGRLEALTGWRARPWRQALDKVLDALAEEEITR